MAVHAAAACPAPEAGSAMPEDGPGVVIRQDKSPPGEHNPGPRHAAVDRA